MQRSEEVSLAEGTAKAKSWRWEQAWHVCRPRRPTGLSRTIRAQSNGSGVQQGPDHAGPESWVKNLDSILKVTGSSGGL